MEDPLEKGLPIWVTAICRATSLEQCVDAFKSSVKPFGVTMFVCGEVDVENRRRSVMHVIEWPDDWTKFYREGFVARDPLLNALMVRTEPFTWRELREDPNLPAQDLQLLNLAAARGWNDGLVTQIPRGGARFGIVSLIRAGSPMNAVEKSMLILLSVLFHERVKCFSARAFAAEPSGISARMKAALQLVGRGFSDKAIARKLEISETTAHGHIEDAKRRLAARTRAEAAAVAISLGIIAP